MKKILAATLICFTAVSCSGLFYYPTAEPVATPKLLGLDYQDVIIKDPDQPDLQAWFIPAKAEEAGTVIFLHGNAGNISTHLPSIFWLPAAGLSVLTFDYRGYGNSSGSPEIHGVHTDIERAIAWIEARPELKSKGLFLYGQSLGASMALYTAALPAYEHTFRAVIAESPFTRYSSIAREKAASSFITWPFQPLVWLLVSDDFSPAKYVKNILCPRILIVSGDADKVVPHHHSIELAALIGTSAELWIAPSKNHLEIFTEADNRKRLIDFMRSS